jgi:hypothetical protein
MAMALATLPSSDQARERGLRSTAVDGTVSINQFGLNGDLPVDGDFDGDGLSDLAVFRPSRRAWFIRRSSNPTNFISVSFGQNGDRPVASDYDKDGKPTSRYGDRRPVLT